jgi:general secretion pathway protein D
VLEHLSKSAGFVIIKDAPVQGTVDVVSHQPLSPDEAVELLNTILARQDLAAVRSERTLRIMSRTAALTADLPVERGAEPDDMERTDAMATQIIPVKYADATKMVENLKPLLDSKAQLSANASSNSLILTDTKRSIRRIAMVVKALDTSISSITEVRVFPLEHAEAEEIADVINKVFEEPTSTSSGSNSRMDFFRRMRRGGPPGMGGEADSGTETSEAKTATTKVTAVGDERSNCVVVSASAEIMAQVEALVKQVDIPTQDDAIVEVFSLRYADAEDVVDVLKEIYADSTSSTQNNTPGGSMRPMFGFGGMRGGTNGGGSTNNNRSLGEADVAVVADTRTNSVVVSASPVTMVAIGKVVAKLDETPKNVTQIYIYHIENADLENLQTILEGMFDDIEDTGTTTSLAPGGGQASNASGGGTNRRN